MKTKKTPPKLSQLYPSHIALSNPNNLEGDLLRVVEVCGPVGCGKSTYCVNQALAWLKLYPPNTPGVFLLSPNHEWQKPLMKKELTRQDISIEVGRMDHDALVGRNVVGLAWESVILGQPTSTFMQNLRSRVATRGVPCLMLLAGEYNHVAVSLRPTWSKV